MTTIHITDRNGQTHTMQAYDESSLMEPLRDEGMGIEAICGGQCACATCHCHIDNAWFDKLPEPGEDEHELLESLEHYDAGRSRLTCQVNMTPELDGLQATVAPEE